MISDIGQACKDVCNWREQQEWQALKPNTVFSRKLLGDFTAHPFSNTWAV